MIRENLIQSRGIRFSLRKAGVEIGHAYLYLMTNDLHDEPFGLMEDVFIEEEHRGHGGGTKLVRKILQMAKREGCYKLLTTSRHSNDRVHDLYTRLGFSSHGLEFRKDF